MSASAPSLDDGVAWPHPAVPTGVGSMPGVDPQEATNIVVGEFGAFPHVVELPARGPGADPIGRTAALLAEVDRSFEVETSVTGWRIGHTGQAHLRRARAWLSWDLETLEASTGSHVGPIKVQVVGPLTLAARLEDPAGEALVRDLGAVAELAAAAASAFGELVSRMRRAFPPAQIVVQVDEPDIPAVLSGRVRTSSGRLTHRSLESPVVHRHLATALEGIAAAGGVGGVRCFQPHAPVDLFVGAGSRFVGVDLLRALPADDALPRAWESGIGLLLGCVPVNVTGTERPELSDAEASAPLRNFMHAFGFAEVPAHVAVTPSGGLARLDIAGARRVIERCARVGAIVRDEHPEVVGG